MTVKELKEALISVPNDTEIYVYSWDFATNRASTITYFLDIDIRGEGTETDKETAKIIVISDN